MLNDILPMSVGRGIAGMQFEPMLPRNSRLPVSGDVIVAADASGYLEMPIFQGEAADVSRNEYLCSALVEDLALWDCENAVLRVAFDENCVMSVEAYHQRTGRALAVNLERTRPLEEILRRLGQFAGPQAEPWQLPPSGIGGVFGKLFKILR